MAIKMQYEIAKALDNLTMATTTEKDVLTQITITIKNLKETKKILMDQINTMMAKITRLIANGEHQQKQGGQENIVNDYE